MLLYSLVSRAVDPRRFLEAPARLETAAGSRAPNDLELEMATVVHSRSAFSVLCRPSRLGRHLREKERRLCGSQS